MHPPLDKIIYEALLADRRSPTGLLHASSHSWQPLRFTQLSQVIHSDESDFGSLMTMAIGTMTHEWLADYLMNHSDIMGDEWLLSIAEWDLTDYLPDGWTGTCDYLFFNRRTNQYVVGDLKTIKPEGVAYLGDRPKPEHTTQVSCYHIAIQKWLDGNDVIVNSLDPDLFVCYLPKGKDSRQTTIMPVIKTAPAEPSAWANMVGIKRQVDEYLAEVERTGELDNQFLAPMPDQDMKVSWNRAQEVWDVVARDPWTVEYIGAQYGEQLCPRQPATKQGHWTRDLFYVPRKGIMQPDSIPEPSPDEIKRRQS